VAHVCPPCQTEPGHTQDMSGMVDDLIGALRLVGGLQEAQIQNTADIIIDQFQQSEGMHATF
jgi:hypothetical protein